LPKKVYKELILTCDKAEFQMPFSCYQRKQVHLISKDFRKDIHKMLKAYALEKQGQMVNVSFSYTDELNA
jgi:hypothetical protein